MLARFLGGLNREIQTILEYKECNNITCLFHLACKAGREVQDRQALARTNFSAGRPLIEARVSRSFDEMITIDLVESTLTIRLRTCEDVAP